MSPPLPYALLIEWVTSKCWDCLVVSGDDMKAVLQPNLAFTPVISRGFKAQSCILHAFFLPSQTRGCICSALFVPWHDTCWQQCTSDWPPSFWCFMVAGLWARPWALRSSPTGSVRLSASLMSLLGGVRCLVLKAILWEEWQHGCCHPVGFECWWH